LHTHTYVFTHVALGVSENERLTGQSQLINYSIKKVLSYPPGATALGEPWPP